MAQGRRGRWLVLLVAIGLTAAAAGYAVVGERSPSDPLYDLEAVTRGDLVIEVTATGTINAVGLVQLGSQISGQVQRLHADFNSVVQAGQIVAEIAPESFAARVAEATAELAVAEAARAAAAASLERARAALAGARAALAGAAAERSAAASALDFQRRERARKLAPGRGDYVTQQDRERAETDFVQAEGSAAAAVAREKTQLAAIAAAEAAVAAAVAEGEVAVATTQQRAAALDLARVDLDRTRIRSPIDGVVIDRSVDVGQTVAASLQAPTLFTIARDLKDLQVETYVDEADIGRIATGQPARFTVASFPDESFAGRVTQIRKGPQLIQNVVTYIVVIATRNDELKLLPGMTASVRIVTAERRNVLKLPNAALRFRPPGAVAGAQRESTVYLLDAAGALVAVPVTIARGDERYAELLGGPLGEGQKVVVSERRPDAKGALPATLFRF